MSERFVGSEILSRLVIPFHMAFFDDIYVWSMRDGIEYHIDDAHDIYFVIGRVMSRMDFDQTPNETEENLLFTFKRGLEWPFLADPYPALVTYNIPDQVPAATRTLFFGPGPQALIGT